MQPIVKPIGAVAGDQLEIHASQLSVNGQPLPNSATQPHDQYGRALPHVPWGTYRVAPGTVWLVATHHSRSWDSRYFGPVDIDTIQSGVVPVWIWEEET